MYVTYTFGILRSRAILVSWAYGIIDDWYWDSSIFIISLRLSSIIEVIVILDAFSILFYESLHQGINNDLPKDKRTKS